MRPELVDMLDVYRLTSDCYAGEKAIKRISTFASGSHGNGGGASFAFGVSPYLPDPSPANEDESVRQKRYRDYINRAVFYNVTRRTVKAMVGAVFAKYPVFELTGLEILETDVNGAGQTLAQQAKKAMTECLLKGRGGLLADMPINQGVSKADMAKSGIRPTVKLYKAESIINWRLKTIGANTKLSLIVLSESYVKSDNGYEEELGQQLLVLRLNKENKAESEILRKDDGGWVSQGINLLTDQRGQPLDELPFYFFGADNNDAEIDDSPLYDIAQLNVAHFRDSADYQESNFIAGQPTLVVSGLTQQWADEVLTNGVSIGARSGLLLPEGGNAQLLQAQANSVNMEAMRHKEQQMTALGAKLIEPAEQAKTATEASHDNAEETSVLTNIAYNISDAYTKAVKACARFMGVDDRDLLVTLNTQFNFAKMTPQQRQQLVAEWQAGLITFAEARAALVEDEVATIENPEEAKRVIEQEQGAMLDQTRADDRRIEQ